MNTETSVKSPLADLFDFLARELKGCLPPDTRVAIENDGTFWPVDDSSNSITCPDTASSFTLRLTDRDGLAHIFCVTQSRTPEEPSVLFSVLLGTQLSLAGLYSKFAVHLNREALLDWILCMRQSAAELKRSP